MSHVQPRHFYREVNYQSERKKQNNSCQVSEKQMKNINDCVCVCVSVGGLQAFSIQLLFIHLLRFFFLCLKQDFSSFPPQSVCTGCWGLHVVHLWQKLTCQSSVRVSAFLLQAGGSRLRQFLLALSPADLLVIKLNCCFYTVKLALCFHAGSIWNLRGGSVLRVELHSSEHLFSCSVISSEPQL